MLGNKWIAETKDVPGQDNIVLPVTFRFSEKDDGRKKARMCARGDLQKIYSETSSSVVSQRSDSRSFSRGQRSKTSISSSSTSDRLSATQRLIRWGRKCI
jgi:hypothetical protein